MEAQVLKQYHPMARIADGRLDLGSDAIRRQRNGARKRLLQVIAHRREGPLGIFLASGTAEMRSQDELFRLCQNRAQRRQCALDAMRFGNLAFFDRDIEVGPDKNSFAGEV